MIIELFVLGLSFLIGFYFTLSALDKRKLNKLGRNYEPGKDLGKPDFGGRFATEIRESSNREQYAETDSISEERRTIQDGVNRTIEQHQSSYSEDGLYTNRPKRKLYLRRKSSN